MRSRARIRLTFFATSVVVLAAFVVACRFTDGLSDGPLEDAGDEAAACGSACPSAKNAVPSCVDGGCAIACLGSFADCDDASATGCEVNVLSDRRNCGKCGHDCMVGDCSNGACLPGALASSIDAPAHIVMDDASVYGVNAYGTLTQMGKNGGTLAVLKRENDVIPQPLPPRIALANNTLYYTAIGADGGGAGGVSARYPDGGVRQIAQADEAFAITATSSYVYWSEGNPKGPSPSGTIRRCSPSNCSGTTQLVINAGNGGISSILADSQNVYWTNAANGPEGSVNRCSIGGSLPCAAQRLADGRGATGLAREGSTLFYTANSGLYSCPADGPSIPSLIASYQYDPHFISVSGGGTGAQLFWTTGDGAVKTTTRTGESSAPPVFERILYQRHTTAAWDIAVDGKAIYWTALAGSAGGPALYKLARP